MIITSNSLTTIRDNGRVEDISGTVEVKLETRDLQDLLRLPSLDIDTVGAYINESGLADDIPIDDARIRSFTVTSLKAENWPELSAVLTVETFSEARRGL